MFTTTGWPCTFCPRKFHAKRALVDHMATAHGAKEEIRCQICGKMFSSKGNLSRHSVLHTGKQKHTCNICGKKFLTLENYTGHMNMHAGVKPFQCTNCLKCFCFKNTLSSHKKSCKGAVDTFYWHYYVEYCYNVDGWWFMLLIYFICYC